MGKRPETDETRLRNRKAREDNNVFSRLPAVYAATRTQAHKLLHRAGNLSTVEWRTLWDLYKAGPMTIRELAEIQRADHSLLSRALPDMRDKGFVTMERDRIDGRQVLVSLAPPGRAVYEQVAPVMKRRRDALRAEFSPEEITTFLDYLERLEKFARRPIDTICESEFTE
ncbi:MarR family winged helix-turn-helix transcriptional regulator [Flavimaricola marinus]|uniref:MarR family protein n=1 Tax=Flavimaricola marinus TaxID=1819565 RepID=A0A238LIB6_9RHOB|nr:MarR family transcriptional regulator [Flavimaricola marinus]SMY09429.1 MarR family protein [Flavimaricola marinus]